MDYQRTVDVRQNPAKALDVVRMTLAQQGFRLQEVDRTTFEAVGPGMNNNHVSPLRGVSRARVGVNGGELTIQAELGAVRNLQRFIRYFPTTLCLFLFGVFYVLAHFGAFPRQGLKVAAIVCGANAALWIPIGLIWAPAMSRGTLRALDTLMENAGVIARG